MSVQAAEAHLEAVLAAGGSLALAARAATLEALERRVAVLARAVEGSAPEAKDLARLMEAEARPRLLASLREDLRLTEAEARLRLTEARVAETEEEALAAGAEVRRIRERHAAALAPLVESEGGHIVAEIETPALTQARKRLTDLESALLAQRDELERRAAEVAVYQEKDQQRKTREAR